MNKNLDIEAKLHNRFDVEVRDAKTGELKQKAVGYNTILNQFWTRLFATQSVYDYIQYGSGTGTPSAADTALFNWVAGVQCGEYSYDDAHYVEGWNSFTRSITLDEQTAVGVNITEVGLAGAANSGLCTHALLQDMNGNSISIAKTNTDIITIYATVYIHWNVNGVNGVKYVPNTHWFGIWRRWHDNCSLYGGKGMGSKRTLLGSDVAPVADATNKKWTWGAPWRIPVGSGNWNGLKHMTLGIGNWTDFIFDVDISGDYQITGESVGTGDGTTTDFTLAVDDANSITVYVDGVEQQSGYSVSYNILSHNYGVDCCCVDLLDKQSTTQVHIPTSQQSGGYGDENALLVYNPYYQQNMILRGYRTYGGYYNSAVVKGSNDLENWSQEYTGPANNGEIINGSCLGYKYYLVKSTTGDNSVIVSTDRPATKIVFSTPPAAGAVITADYKTPFLPKDIDHVYDFSLTVQLGEYTPS